MVGKLQSSSDISYKLIKTNNLAEQRLIQIPQGYFLNRFSICVSLPVIPSDLCRWSSEKKIKAN